MRVCSSYGVSEKAMNIFYFWQIMIDILNSTWFLPIAVGYLGLLSFSLLVNLLNGD